MFAPIIQVCAVRWLCWHASLSVQNRSGAALAPHAVFRDQTDLSSRTSCQRSVADPDDRQQPDLCPILGAECERRDDAGCGETRPGTVIVAASMALTWTNALQGSRGCDRSVVVLDVGSSGASDRCHDTRPQRQMILSAVSI
jgi:hypothetical protein